ncbi:hypothetical protein SK128_003370 [Halocaridina rubra]|uniref:Kinesin-associated microtubule-binding domain-containing protein n=1 Tax=Halocaridina rubra TaxID=373956 RepID=A0AAN8WMA0_HALRR
MLPLGSLGAKKERLIVPPGETPVRKDYKFSRILATTSPHEKILERYRKGSANTTSKIPLPVLGDDIEDDEILSPNDSIGHLDVFQVDEDSFQTKSLSGSVTDIRSNSGSVTDLRPAKSESNVFAMPLRPTGGPVSRGDSDLALSKSSSASSIPEIKDKENSSLVQKVNTTSKRKLRPPSEKSSNPDNSNTRSRRILSTQN